MPHEIPYIAAINEAIHLEMARDDSVLYFGQNLATTENDEFVKAFGQLSEGCNACHQAANVGEVTQLVDLYAMVSMMRVISSAPIVESANHVVRLIADSYVSPKKTLKELHQMMDTDSIDALRDFSDACRDELRRFRVI